MELHEEEEENKRCLSLSCSWSLISHLLHQLLLLRTTSLLLFESVNSLLPLPFHSSFSTILQCLECRKAPSKELEKLEDQEVKWRPRSSFHCCTNLLDCHLQLQEQELNWWILQQSTWEQLKHLLSFKSHAFPNLWICALKTSEQNWLQKWDQLQVQRYHWVKQCHTVMPSFLLKRINFWVVFARTLAIILFQRSTQHKLQSR